VLVDGGINAVGAAAYFRPSRTAVSADRGRHFR